jgi:hypothetical protein
VGGAGGKPPAVNESLDANTRIKIKQKESGLEKEKLTK